MRNLDPMRVAAIEPQVPNYIGAHPLAVEPFGTVAVKAPEGGLLHKWRRVQGEIANEAKVLSLCRARSFDCPSGA